MSSTGGKVAQVVALVVGVILVVLGIRQITNKSEPAATTTTGTTSSTAEAITTTTTAAAGGGAPTSILTTTTSRRATTTTLQPLNGTVDIKPSPNFGTSYPYPRDPANPAATPTIEWSVTVPAGQTAVLHGPAPGTPEADLSGGAKGEFSPCPGTIANNTCTVPAGAYTYSVQLVADGAVVSQKSVTLVIGATGGGGGGNDGNPV